MFKKTLLAAAGALTLTGAAITASSPAQAQVYFGTSYGSPYGYSNVGYGGGYYGGHYGGYRPVRYYGDRYAYRPARYYGGYPYGYRRSNGGAVAAGLIGGLALGALAATAARPAYYYPTTYAAPCYIERRRVYDRYGRIVVQRVQVCN
jgi:hypothetical protein